MPWLTKLVYVVFAILVPILLLNMLIAMFVNTYERVIVRSEKEWKRQWAKIIFWLERTFPPPGLLKFQLDYSVEMEDGRRGLMVIKQYPKSKARQRKEANSNWKKAMAAAKNSLKRKDSEDSQPIRRPVISRIPKAASTTATAARETPLVAAAKQLAWENDIDLKKGKNKYAGVRYYGKKPNETDGRATIHPASLQSRYNRVTPYLETAGRKKEGKRADDVRAAPPRRKNKNIASKNPGDGAEDKAKSRKGQNLNDIAEGKANCPQGQDHNDDGCVKKGRKRKGADKNNAGDAACGGEKDEDKNKDNDNDNDSKTCSDSQLSLKSQSSTTFLISNKK